MCFGLRILDVVDSSPSTSKGRIIANQLSRSGTSVGANYRAACRAKSRADFIHKMGTVEEETDETSYWLEMIIRAKMLPAKRLQPLLDESNEILAVVVASINTAKRNKR